MCSTPKARTAIVRPRKSASGMTSGLSGEQYQQMVRRSNQAWERRQQRKAQQKPQPSDPLQEQAVASLPESSSSEPALTEPTTPAIRLSPLLQYLRRFFLHRT